MSDTVQRIHELFEDCIAGRKRDQAIAADAAATAEQAANLARELAEYAIALILTAGERNQVIVRKHTLDAAKLYRVRVVEGSDGDHFIFIATPA